MRDDISFISGPLVVFVNLRICHLKRGLRTKSNPSGFFPKDNVFFGHVGAEAPEGTVIVVKPGSFDIDHALRHLGDAEFQVVGEFSRRDEGIKVIRDCIAVHFVFEDDAEAVLFRLLFG